MSLSALAGWWTCYRLHHHQYYYHHYHYAFIIINIHISVSKAVITVLAPVPAKPRDCCLKGSKNEPTHPTEHEGTTVLQRYPLKFASGRPRHILSTRLVYIKTRWSDSRIDSTGKFTPGGGLLCGLLSKQNKSQNVKIILHPFSLLNRKIQPHTIRI